MLVGSAPGLPAAILEVVGGLLAPASVSLMVAAGSAVSFSVLKDELKWQTPVTTYR